MELLKEIVNQLLPLVLTAVIPYLGVLLGKLIGRGFDQLEASTKSHYLKQILEVAETAVLNSYQTFLKGAKQKLADGKIDAEEYKQLKSEAKQAALDLVQGFIEGLPKIAQDFLKDKAAHLVEGAIPKVKAKQMGLPINPTEPGPAGK